MIKTKAVSTEMMETVILMLESQNIYILSKIKDAKYKRGYENTMNRFIIEAKVCNNYTDFRMYYEVFNEQYSNRKISLFDRCFKANEREGSLLALETIKDALDSIDTRFINGGFKLYEELLNLKIKGINAKKR